MTNSEKSDGIIDRLRNLSPEQRLQLEQTLASRANVATRPIPRRAPDCHIPLSFGQKRMWFLNRLQPDLTNYIKTSAVRLTGLLDRNALVQTFGEVIRRHHILRTTYRQAAIGPVQRVQDDWSFQLPVQDLSHLSESEREHQTRRLIEQEAGRAFDLMKDRSLRALLIVHSQNVHVLATTLHHIAMDAWSRNLLWKELSVLYDAFSNGKPSPLTELPIQYADFAIWQLERISGPAMTRQLEYWKRRLASIPPLLELPGDRPRPPVPSGRGGRLRIEISETLKGPLTQLARQERATPYMVLLAAFQTLIHRYTGQKDIAVGTPMAGRPRVETEPLIGYLVSTVVIRADLSGNPSFRTLLKQVRNLVFEGFENQGFPFERLVEVLAPERRLSHQPLVQVMFSLKNVPIHKLVLSGIQCEIVPVESTSAKFDLWFELVDQPNGLRGKIEYNSDLFDVSTIERLFGHYCKILEGILADPDQRIGQIPLLPEQECHQILVDWNTAFHQQAGDSSLHELFERQVERTPDAIAIDSAGHRLTYRELNSRANRLAHQLRDLSVGPDVLVAICMERSVELIVGILGILKAGGAYLPLDINHPRERLMFMLQDSGAGVLITQQSLLSQLPHEGRQVICMDTDIAAMADSPAENLCRRVEPHHLAYVLFTSGSTGKPKGVMIEHRSVVTFITWACQKFSRDDLAGVLASTSICFDLSVFEIFAPLSCGGMVILARDALALPKLSAARDVTLLNTVPSTLTELIISKGIPSTVHTITLGGEFVPQHVVNEAYAKTNATRVFDLYGPTEATVYAMCALRTPDCLQTIGRPIANNRILILNSDLQLAPIGIPGELHIGGDGLARGYLNRPELTAERFIADPFGGPRDRLYKTGDLARILPDGNFEFLGRLDHQVKLRGFRIELGEIEAVLRPHPKVRDVAVVAREDEPGNRKLVAYVVPIENGVVSVAELRDAANALPTYMIPSAFVVLDQMPLTPNGKLDRRALPAPNFRTVQSEIVAARDTVELQLTKIWEDVLKVRPIGIHDDFFELGGHSLLAMRLIDQITQVTGRDLPLTTLFECSTVAHLGDVLRNQNWAPRWTSLTPIQSGGSKPPLFLIPPAAGSVLRFKPLADQLGSDQPVYGLEPLGHTDEQTPHVHVGEMAEWYLNEIEELQPSGPYLLAGICFGSCIALEMAQQLLRRGQSVPLLLLLDSAVPAHGPTWSWLPPNGIQKENMAELWDSPELAGSLQKHIDKRIRYLQSLDVQVSNQMRRMVAAHLKAELTYTATEYAGSVLLIQSEEYSRNPQTRDIWARLTMGGLSTVVLKGTGHRDLLLGTRAMPTLARVLNEYLSRI